MIAVPRPSRRACESLLWLILFFGPAAFGSTEWWSRALLESASFILAAFCALRWDFISLSAPVVGFGAIICVAVAQEIWVRPLAVPAGLLPFTLSRPQTLYALLFWAALLALLWSACGILRWEGALRRSAWIIFGIGLFIAVVGILQLSQGNTDYYGLRPIRHGLPFGPFTNHNHAATWMAAAVLAGAGIIAAGFRRGRMPVTELIARQVLCVFMLAVLVAGVLETTSRGGLNALLFSALISGYLVAGALARRWQRWLARTGMVAAAGLYVAFLFTNPQWLGINGNTFDESAAYRLSMYRSGLRMLGDFPAFGVGLGCFANAFHAYQEPLIVGLVDHVHSSWLEMGLELGLFGLGALGMILLWPLVALGRRLVAGDFPERPIAAGYFAAILAFALHGIIEFSLQIPGDAVLLVVLLAAAVAALPASSKPTLAVTGAGRAVLAGAFLVLAVLSLPPGFSRGVARLGAPFESAADELIQGSTPKANSLIGAWDRLLLDPSDPRLRYDYGVALWKAKRFEDAKEYLQDQRQTK